MNLCERPQWWEKREEMNLLGLDFPTNLNNDDPWTSSPPRRVTVRALVSNRVYLKMMMMRMLTRCRMMKRAEITEADVCELGSKKIK